MKVKDLFSEIAECLREYGNDFMDWNIAVENNRKPEECPNCKDNILKDQEGWEYVKCHGYWTKMPKEKVLTINIHY